MKNFLPALICLALAGCGTPETPAATVAPAAASAAPDAMAEPVAPAPAATANPETYGQYLTCKINGHFYLAYYDENHLTNVTNSMNLANRADFDTHTDFAPVNGENVSSSLSLVFFDLAKKRVGTYTSPDGFHINGQATFAKASGPGVDKYSFTIAKNQTLTVTSLENGIVKGNFTADVMDDRDPDYTAGGLDKQPYHLTEGHFKLALNGGLKEVKVDKNGDVDLQKAMKDMMK